MYLTPAQLVSWLLPHLLGVPGTLERKKDKLGMYYDCT